MSDRRFFDTTILVYSRDLTDTVKHRIARELLGHAWEHRSGRISTQVLSEYYVTVTQKLDPGLPREEAWRDVAALAAWRPLGVTMECLDLAREVQSEHDLSWWDSLIVAAARLTGSTLLLSEDLSHGRVYRGVTVVNPFTE